MATENVPSTAVTLAKQPRTIKDLIQSADFEAAVKAGMPKHLKVDRFMRVALNATLRQPELLECNRESFFLRMLELSILGIEPDGRRAHLIPFWNNKFCGNCNHPKDQHRGMDCQISGCGCKKAVSRREVQLIVDYKGIAELVRRSGDVSYMHCDAVYERDEWDFKYGSGAFLTHKPNLDVEDRGRVRCFYSFVRLADGNEDFVVMPKSDVDKIRRRSKSADSGPWVSDYNEMGKKTVFRNHSKWLPLSPDVKDAVESDDEAIDMKGALSIAAAEGVGTSYIGGETVEEHDEKLDRKMAEQAKEEEPKPAGVPDDPKSETVATTTATVTPISGAPWANLIEMEAAFQARAQELGDEQFYQILGANGISGADDMQLSNPATVTAYAELKAAVREKTVKPEGPKLQFGRRDKK